MTIFERTDEIPHCHASTIEADSNGNLVAAWFAGSWEAHPDTAIMTATATTENGVWIWGKPERLIKAHEKVAHWNPVLFRAPDGFLHLYFRVGLSPMDWQTLQMIYLKGKWVGPKQFGGYGGRGPVRSKPIVLSNGHWLAPGSLEIPWRTERFAAPKVEWVAFVDCSENNGDTWEATDNLKWDEEKPKGGVIQPTLWESTPGNVHMLLRSTLGCICRSDSTDYGKTWSPIVATDLPNPNSAIDVMRVGERLVLAYNNCSGNWAARTPLTVAFSDLEGKNWTGQCNIESGSQTYSYPTLVAHEERVYMTYTYRRNEIRFCEIDLPA